MKVPWVCVKKQPKLEPTTHCHPDPLILSNSCSCCQRYGRDFMKIRKKWMEMRRSRVRGEMGFLPGYLFDVGCNACAVTDVIEIKSLGGRVHGLELHLHWHVCVKEQSFAFQHSLSLQGKLKREDFFYFFFWNNSRGFGEWKKTFRQEENPSSFYSPSSLFRLVYISSFWRSQ